MKATPKTGDLIKIETSDEILEGVYMPNSNEKNIILKLSSGYNIGVNRKKIKSIKIMKRYKEKTEKLPKIKNKDGLKNVVILHTGGTVASKVSYETGGVTPAFSPEELINKFPEIKDIV